MPKRTAAKLEESPSSVSVVGGGEAAFQRALPLFEAMGKTIVHVGPAGAGQVVKVCNQVTVRS